MDYQGNNCAERRELTQKQHIHQHQHFQKSKVWQIHRLLTDCHVQ